MTDTELADFHYQAFTDDEKDFCLASLDADDSDVAPLADYRKIDIFAKSPPFHEPGAAKTRQNFIGIAPRGDKNAFYGVTLETDEDGNHTIFNMVSTFSLKDACYNAYQNACLGSARNHKRPSKKWEAAAEAVTQPARDDFVEAYRQRWNKSSQR